MGWNISEEAQRPDTAARTFAFDRMALSSAQQVRMYRDRQQRAADGQCFRTTAVSEEAEVTDFDKAWRQDVKQKTPNEFDRINRHNLLSVVVG